MNVETWPKQGSLIAYPFPDNGMILDPRFRKIQEEGLIKVQLPFGDPCWLLTRYQDVKTALDGRIFSRAQCLTSDAPGMFPSSMNTDSDVLLNMDPPQHSRIKALAGPSFSPARVQRLSVFVQQVIDDLLNEMENAEEPYDFVEHFTSVLPVRTLAHLLGVPQDQAFEFKTYAEQAVRAIFEADEAARERGFGTIGTFVMKLVNDRRDEATDDVLSDLVHVHIARDQFSDLELLRLAESIWLGGFKTTASQLGLVVLTLINHRDIWTDLCRSPELVPGALNELWRWIPAFRPGMMLARYATQDITFSDGTVVKAGEAVMPEISVANRDDRAYPDGWTLDIRRQTSVPHLSFALGTHACLGQHVAKLQIKLTLDSLLRRFPNLQLAGQNVELTWDDKSILRTMEKLPLVW